MKTFLFSLLTTATFPLTAVAQGSAFDNAAAAQANLNALSTSMTPAVLPAGGAVGLSGSPYLDRRWLVARLQTTTSSQALAPVPLKYDLLGQRLLMKRLDRPNDSLQLDDRRVAGFALEEPATATAPARVRVFRRFLEAADPSQRAEYVEVLHEGRYTLLRRYFKRVKKADYEQAYGSSERYDQIEDRTQYYLLRPDKILMPLKPNAQLSLKLLQAAAPELVPALQAAPGAGQARTEAEWAAVLAAADPK